MSRTTSRAVTVLSIVAGLLVASASPGLATDGTLDPSFSTDGVTVEKLSVAEGRDSGSGVDVRSDGSIYVAGGEAIGFSRFENTPLLSRFTSSGQLDTTFGSDGVAEGAVGYEASWRHVEATSDGGAVVLGNGDSERWNLAKYTQAGTLDTAFSGDGLVGPPAGVPDAQAFELLQQADGKFVVVGLDCQRFGTNACDNVVVQRLTSAGAPDTTFGSGGTALVPTDYLSQQVGAALDASGRVVFASAGYVGAGSSFGSVVGRFTTGGLLDSSFNGTGLRTFAGEDSFELVGVDSASRPILVYTDFGSDFTTVHQVRRLTASGGDDNSYGTASGGALDTSGWVSTNLQSVEVLPDDTVVIVGSGGENATNEGSFSYARIVGPNGGPDTRLSPTGEKVVLLGGGEYARYAGASITDPQGRLIFAGNSYETNDDQRTLVGRVRGPAVGVVGGLAVAPSPGALTASWSAPSSGPAPTSYSVTLSPGDVTRTVTGTTTTFTGLVNGSEHSVTVRANSADLSGAVAGPVSGTPNGCVPTRFSDVAAGHPFCSQIAWMVANGITNGTTVADGSVEYRPALPVSRSAMAPFLYRTLDSPPFTAPAEPSFADVPTTHPFYKEIEWMRAAGISTGTIQPTGKPLYKPTDAVTRQAMAPFLYRAASSPPFTAPAAATFADVGTNHPFFKEIEWMASTGISTGTAQPTGKPLYKPGDAVSRQAMAAFLNRLSLQLS